MSNLRRKLFEFQKERIEMTALRARKIRGGEPFVVLVLDLNDQFAVMIAVAKSTQHEVDAHIKKTRAEGVSPCLILDTSYGDADVFFESSDGWTKAKSSPLGVGSFLVAIVGDGGVSFTTHRLPS